MAGGLWTKGCVPGPGYTGLPLLLEPQPWVGHGHWEPRWEVVPPAQPSPALLKQDFICRGPCHSQVVWEEFYFQNEVQMLFSKSIF